ncbi:MAG: hypothetical protein CM15mP120_26580 [Pseudomonadota bacterium]|nr:MAG: hypothetical protein CM15mP120_26580 [Pseudomonadota bacterium]
MASEISVLLANRTTLMAGFPTTSYAAHPYALALALLPDDIDKQLVRRFENNLESMDELIRDALRFSERCWRKSQNLSLYDC